MSIVIAVAETRVVANPLPPAVSRKVAAFLAAGHTGQIVLDIKDGRVLAYKLTEAGRVPAAELDSNRSPAQDSDH